MLVCTTEFTKLPLQMKPPSLAQKVIPHAGPIYGANSTAVSWWGQTSMGMSEVLSMTLTIISIIVMLLYGLYMIQRRGTEKRLAAAKEQREAERHDAELELLRLKIKQETEDLETETEQDDG